MNKNTWHNTYKYLSLVHFTFVAHKTIAHLPFHPLFQQLQGDLAHQVDQESLGVLVLRWVQSLQLVPVKDNRDILRKMYYTCTKSAFHLCPK